MQLVLVAGFKASAGKVGPNVRLFAGNWKLVVENQKDSILILRREGLHEVAVHDGNIFDSKSVNHWIEVQHPGTEPFINVFAEYINGSNSPKST
jgi:hypothetical protein